MIVYDTLSELESYQGAFPQIATIITVMDRSLPYDQGQGSYDTPEKSDVRYIIDEFISSQNGFHPELLDGSLVMEIAISGDEIVSVDGSVFRLGEGSFLIYDGGADVKRGVMWSIPGPVKAVRFIF